MINPYISEVSLFAFKFAPEGWVKCEGELISVTEFSQLFAVIGKQYGGDGIATFGLPKLPSFWEDYFYCMSAFGLSPTIARATLPAETTILPVVPPPGWVQAAGQLLPIAQNQALFQILGTKFGGDGTATFGVPDMYNVAPFNEPGDFGYLTYFIATLGSTDQGFMGEVKIFPSTVSLAGWLPCDGRTMSIQQDTALFTLLGTEFGGDGKTTFALPKLQVPYPDTLPMTYYICVDGVYPGRP